MDSQAEAASSRGCFNCFRGLPLARSSHRDVSVVSHSGSAPPYQKEYVHMFSQSEPDTHNVYTSVHGRIPVVDINQKTGKPQLRLQVNLGLGRMVYSSSNLKVGLGNCCPVFLPVVHSQAKTMREKSEDAFKKKAAQNRQDEKAEHKMMDAKIEAKDNPRKFVTSNTTNRLPTDHMSCCHESDKSIIMAVAAAPIGADEPDTLQTAPRASCASTLPRVIFRGGAATTGGTIYLRLGCSIARGGVLNVTVVSRHVLHIALAATNKPNVSTDSHSHVSFSWTNSESCIT